MVGSASGAAVATVAIVLGIVVSIAIYLLPIIIGLNRKVVHLGSVIAVNLLLGWTLVGWVVALAMALRTNPPYHQPWESGSSAAAPSDGYATPAQSPPGWYLDPSGVMRWWDGAQWTPETQPG